MTSGMPTSTAPYRQHARAASHALTSRASTSGDALDAQHEEGAREISATGLARQGAAASTPHKVRFDTQRFMQRGVRCVRFTVRVCRRFYPRRSHTPVSFREHRGGLCPQMTEQETEPPLQQL